MATVNLTKAQADALQWLRDRTGDAVFDSHGVLLAAGERAPFMRSTWNKLRDRGLISFYRPIPRGPSRVCIGKYSA